MEKTKSVTLMIFILILCSMSLIMCDVTVEERFVVVDGILVDKTDLINTQSKQKQTKEKVELKAKIDQKEAQLYNESREWTKNLPNKCQVCRLMVTEIQRKLKKFGKVRTMTKQEKPLYYKDDMVLWNVFDELCIEMTKYNIDKTTPFRYRRGVKSYLRRKTDEMTEHAQQTQWFWNIKEADIDDPTGEIRRLSKQCNKMLIAYQDDIRRWFYTSQNSDPLKWLCAKKILKSRDPHGCLWIQDEYLDGLIRLNKNTIEEMDSETNSKNSHEEL